VSLDGTTADTPARYGSLFANQEFRALWLAQMLSVLGDQLARVALTVLVYDRTRSPLLAAVTFAASVLPVFLGGLLLSGLADRWPRRQVMIACDLARLGLVLIMATPGAPLALLVVLLFLVTMIGTPFTSARSGMYPDILPGDSFALGTAVTMTTYQFAQVAGFAGGGTAVGLVGVRPALLADAATFAVSALITWIGVRPRPASRPSGAAVAAGDSHPASLEGIAAGIRLAFGRPALRTPMLLGCVAAFYNAPEGIAAPLARSLGGGPMATGLIHRAGTLGPALGAVTFTRLARPGTRTRLMRPLAVACCAVLMLFATGPALPAAMLILFVSGLFDCFQVAAVSAFVQAAPQTHRSQVFGLAQAVMSLGQGAAMVAAGALAQHLSPSSAVALIGGIGAVAAVVISASRELPGRLRPGGSCCPAG
jgi:MFS family permease